MQTGVWAALQQRVCAWLPQRFALESPGNVLICGKGAGGWLAGWQSWRWLPWLRTLPRVVSPSAFPQQYKRGSWKGRQEKKKKKWEPTATITLSVQRELPNRQHQGTALPWKCYKMALCSANAMCAQIHSQICQHRCFYRWQPSNKVLRQGAWFPLGSCCSENCEAPSVRLSFAQILLSVSICINNGGQEVHARCPWSCCWISVVFQVLLLLSQMHLLGCRAENRLWAKVQ